MNTYIFSSNGLNEVVFEVVGIIKAIHLLLKTLLSQLLITPYSELYFMLSYLDLGLNHLSLASVLSYFV